MSHKTVELTAQERADRKAVAGLTKGQAQKWFAYQLAHVSPTEHDDLIKRFAFIEGME